MGDPIAVIHEYLSLRTPTPEVGEPVFLKAPAPALGSRRQWFPVH